MKIEQMSIDQIGLSARSRNALHRMEVHSVGDLLGYTEETLSAGKNLGKKSVEEILAKIEEYKSAGGGGLPETNASSPAPSRDCVDFQTWLADASHRGLVTEYLKEKGSRIDELELLSARAFNHLMLQGCEKLHEIVFSTREELLQIPRMDAESAAEIEKLTRRYIIEHAEDILTYAAEKAQAAALPRGERVTQLLLIPEQHDAILRYVKANDRDIQAMGLSKRPQNRLLQEGYSRMSDLVFVRREDLNQIPSLGTKSIEEILDAMEAYWKEHGERLAAFCAGDDSVLWDDGLLQKRILDLYQDAPFLGLSLTDITERLDLPESVTQTRLKALIGGLLAAKKLEYVDFRCYRVYESFHDYLEVCPNLDARSRDFLRKRLQGGTLEAIAQENGVTRERVRQVVEKGAAKVRSVHCAETGVDLFDEDYYRCLYEDYNFDKKEAGDWLGVPAAVWNYLELNGVKRGSKELKAALDNPRLGISLRLKIKTYLNRNRLYIDGKWVNKKRADLEEIVAEKFCREDISFDEFVQRYNEFLEEEEVAYDEDVYYTPAVYRSRKNRLSEARFLLWKQNEQLRYYDVDGRDYEELLETLKLNAYQNVELSTLKFMETYPEVMKKYDIRDQYELHNLLRKIVPQKDYPNLSFGRMPELKFGNFDRDAAIFRLLVENAPISTADLAELVHREYGYDPTTVAMNYLTPFAKFYHQGYYTVDQKVMPDERRSALQNRLTGDFYYLDEVRDLYREMYPDADLEEVNPYNLKAMGFSVFSNYVLQHYASLEEYFTALLTREDVMDLSAIHSRFVGVQQFYQTLQELKRDLSVVELEPNRIIQLRKLERSGITREMLRSFCRKVYSVTDDGAYFTIQSLREEGFASKLEEYGFSDWFYANLLLSDSRFSYSRVFGNIVFYKGSADVTIKSFLVSLIRAQDKVDVYELMSQLSRTYGCHVDDKWDLIYKVQNTEVYYDRILDRLYANADLYYQELDEM